MLDENTLKQGIEEAFKLGAAAGSYPAVAALLAKAIHTYVNTAEIKIPITTEVLGSTGPCAVGAPAVVDGVLGIAKGTGIVQAGPGSALI